MTRYVALLRGINVGGRNLIAMTALRACFEAQGFLAVSTYIQSGNVLFESDEPARDLTARIEEALARRFDYAASVVLRSRRQMESVTSRAPDGFGAQPATYRYDVLFLKGPLTAESAMKEVAAKPGVDEVYAGPGVLYFSRLIARASESQLTRLVSLPIYRSMTIRNWNTTTTLVERMRGGGAP